MSMWWRVVWKAQPLEEEVRQRGLGSAEAERGALGCGGGGDGSSGWVACSGRGRV
ncbi:hypothetical protein QJS10_CPA03g00131 [Acorus calamus]|uniref:Uncharacterized protein n=1 Tax=Acorus calamus TaxID=4465 RepID=A0AAV9F7S3_ACOCL|nr:hypothetical protein QJS10_CPA03g00131 [Acorus calamus]